MILPHLPTPNPKQLEWYRREKAAFFHFTVNTFTGREWGDGSEDPAIFNPVHNDCRQWMKAIKDAGFTAAILTAKHHDGFCLWPSKYTEHSIKNSPYKNGKGDIVREFTDACRAYGIKAGIYLSPWDRNHPRWGTEEYNDYYNDQLTELLTEYGKIWEVWWDGAGSTEAVYDWKRWATTVKTLQPDAVIYGSLGATPYVDLRWVGNEGGRAGQDCFATITSEAVEKEDTAVMNTGDVRGDRFIPAECDMSIRPGWFYHEDQNAQVKTPKRLMEYWFDSVGKNCGILLNIPPNPDGRLDDCDIRSLTGFAERLELAFRHDLAGDAAISRQSDVWSVSFDLPTRVNCFRLAEDISCGERIRGFGVEGFCNDERVFAFDGKCVGNCRCERIPEVTLTRLTVTVTESVGEPQLSGLSVFYIPDAVFAEEPLSAIESTVGIHDISVEGNATVVNFGGIYPFDRVEFSARGNGAFSLYAFNGARYEKLCDGALTDGKADCAFETVNGCYQIKIVLEEAATPENIRVTRQ